MTVPVVMAVADVKREFAEKCVVPLRIMSFHCIPGNISSILIVRLRVIVRGRSRYFIFREGGFYLSEKPLINSRLRKLSLCYPGKLLGGARPPRPPGSVTARIL